MKAEKHFTFQVEKLSLGLIINLEDLLIQTVVWHQGKNFFWVFEAADSGYGVVYFSVTPTQNITYIKQILSSHLLILKIYFFKYALILIRVVTAMKKHHD